MNNEEIGMGASVIPEEVWGHLLALSPGATLEAYFRAATDSRTHLTAYMGLLESNPAYHHLMQSLDVFQARLKKWEEAKAKEAASTPAKATEGAPAAAAAPVAPDRPTVVSATQMFSALGRFTMRDAMATLRMLNTAKVSPLPRFKKDSFTLSTKEMTSFASRVESFCEDKRWANPEMAYFAGLAYDWTAFRMGQEKSTGAKEGRAYLDEAFKEGFRTAQIAHGITSHYSNLKHAERVFGASLLLPIGKAWIAWLYPKAEGAKGSYKELAEKWSGATYFRREQWLTQERKKFPITHAELSALVAGFARFFRPVEKAIHHYLDPGPLKRVAPDQHALAQILCAASIVSNSPELLSRFDLESPRLSKRDQSILRSIQPVKPEHWAQIVGAVKGG